MRKKKTPKIFENIEVTDVGAKGKAIAKAPDGRVIFMTGTIPGDVVTLKTIKQRKAYYEARVVSFHKYSDKRVTPLCRHFQYCGGCTWQNMAYEHQLAYKEKEVYENLKRIGHLELPKPLPIKACVETYNYRNKMEFSFAAKRWLTREEIKSGKAMEAQPACGFHISGMWDKVLDIEQCHLQAAPSNAIRNFIKNYAIAKKMSFFDPRSQTGFLRNLMIRNTSTGEIMVVVHFFYDDKALIKRLLDAVIKQFPDITSLQYVVNQKANDTIYDQEIILYNGKDYIIEKMEELAFRIHAKSFYQVHSKQAYQLYKIVRDFLDLQGNEIVYDLYSGIGTISQFVAGKAKKVIGIEIVPEAVNDAIVNAKCNRIQNTTFLTGDMKNLFDEELIATQGKPDALIADPPRDGMHKNVIKQLLKGLPQKVVYVSCNSATQARDLALMKEAYRVVKTQAVDMFPQTYHVENVVLLELRNCCAPVRRSL